MNFGTWTRTAVIVCTPVLALGLTACGSSDSESSSATPSAPVTPTNVTAGDEEFCQALADFDNQTNLSDIDDNDNPTDAQMTELAGQIDSFNSANAETMPADIKPAFEALSADLKSISGSSDTDSAQLKSAIDTIRSLEQISDWTKTNCGFDF